MTKNNIGLSSIGYVAHKYAKTTLIVTLILFGFMVAGYSKIVFNSSVTDIFKSDDADYRLYEYVNGLFSENNDQIYLTISGKDLMTPKNIEKLNELHLELEFHDDIEFVTSPFSMRKAPDENGNLEPLFPANIDQNNLAKVLEEAKNHPGVGGQLLAKDNSLILYILSFKPDSNRTFNPNRQDRNQTNEERVKYLEFKDNLKKQAQEIMGNDQLEFEMSGSKILSANIIGYMLFDQRIFLISGILFGITISWIYFRRGKFVLLAGAPTIVSLVTLDGIVGWVGIEKDVLSNVAPILIMVISFCDSVHIVYGIRRRMENGLLRDDAIRETIKHIGPACVLTSITTGMAMVSLLVAQHPIISKFGLLCTFGTGFAFVVTLTFIPAVAKLILPEKMELRHIISEDTEHKTKQPILHRVIGQYTELCKKVFMFWPKQVAALAIIMVCALGALYSLNEPRYKYSSNLPSDNEAYIGISKIDQKLSGANQIRIFIEFEKDFDLKSEESFELYRALEKELAQVEYVKKILSLTKLRDFLQTNQSDQSAKQFFDYIEAQGASIESLLLEDEKVALVTALLPDIDSSDLLEPVLKLERRIAVLDQKYDFAKLHVTGVVPLTTKSSYYMIDMLNNSLLIAIMGGVLIVGVVYRSVFAGFFALVANTIPIGLAGLFLYLTDQGLAFTTVVAFTIGFGIAVDNTIHILHRYNRAISDGLDIEDALKATMDSVVSVLVVTSIVLAFGVGIVILSQMPLIRLYGATLMMLVIAALLADTLLLPAAMRIVKNYEKKALAKQDAKNKTA